MSAEKKLYPIWYYVNILYYVLICTNINILYKYINIRYMIDL